jgi:hypothetical protein
LYGRGIVRIAKSREGLAQWVLVCLTVLVFTSCSNRKLGSQAGNKVTPSESSRNALLLKYSQEHNAILNWKTSFADKKRPLTVDFQRALARHDGHPTTFEARLRDVYLLSDRLFMLLSVKDSPRRLDLVLEVPPGLEEQVSKPDFNEKKDLIVLADVESVDRPLPGISEPDVLVAHGKCVAVYGYDQSGPPGSPEGNPGRMRRLLSWFAAKWSRMRGSEK